MIEFDATYFDGKSSKAYPVRIVSDGLNVSVWGDEGQALRYIPLHQCVITPPMGNARRCIKFPDGAQCETDNLQAASDLEEYIGSNQGMQMVNSLEINWKFAAACLGGIVVFVWIFIIYGIPLMAQIATPLIPSAITEKISQQAMNMLDKNFTQPSQLDLKKAEQISILFQELCREAEKNFNYRIEFRKSPRIGPNAFALPSGMIVMTDELVRLAANDNEIRGVLVHEMAHVRHRHGIRSVLQNAGVFLIVSILVGDVTSITSVAATLPTVLVEAGYSRKFEKEADREAGLYFIKKGLNTSDYQSILMRLGEEHKEHSGLSLLSTHPMTEERIKYLQSLETSTPPPSPPRSGEGR
jgi:Zn-dependent protease with chaperone function